MLFRVRTCSLAVPIAARRPRVDSGWSLLALAILLAVLAGGVIALVALLGGGKSTVASRSAAAFEEAQRKGIPVGEAAHGGHGAASPSDESGGHADPGKPSAEHGGHGSTATPGTAEAPGHDGHATAGSIADGPHAGMQHGAAASGSASQTPSHTDMQHGTPSRASTARSPSHAGMPHGSSAQRPGASQPSTAGHGAHGGPPPAGAPPPPLARSAVAVPGQPAATLEPDSLDAPAATSQIDAKRSSEMAAQMGSGGHGMQHGTGSYSQLDAGRESVQPSPPAMPDHPGMDHGSMPPATPTPATTQPRPAVTPAPTPRGHVHPGGGHR
jgi:hypothetical protein